MSTKRPFVLIDPRSKNLDNLCWPPDLPARDQKLCQSLAKIMTHDWRPLNHEGDILSNRCVGVYNHFLFYVAINFYFAKVTFPIHQKTELFLRALHVLCPLMILVVQRASFGFPTHENAALITLRWISYIFLNCSQNNDWENKKDIYRNCQLIVLSLKILSRYPALPCIVVDMAGSHKQPLIIATSPA